MKKGVILVMSCEQERYINEEAIIRKTWAKPIINGEVEKLSIIFYRGGAEEESFDEEKCLLKLKSPDDLNGTYEKTQAAFRYLENNKIEYDYVFRTNTSTYINIDALIQFLEFEDMGEDVMYTSHLVVNKLSNHIPYGGGHYLIIPRKLIIELFLIYEPKDLKCSIDDPVIGYLMGAYYCGEYLEKHILQVDSISTMREPYFNDLSTAYCVRIKDEENPENNIVNMIGLHILYKNLNIQTKINKPHGFTKINTLYGKIPIDEKHG